MIAAEEGNLALCRFLIEEGANPEASNKEGLKAVDYARERAHQDIVDYLQSI
jgi:ankyrin repeat protein